MQQTRKQLPTHLETFDFPQMNPNCLERRDSTVAPQALHLMNNGMVDAAGRATSPERVGREAGDDPAGQVERVYRIALEPPADAPRRSKSGRRRWTGSPTSGRSTWRSPASRTATRPS